MSLVRIAVLFALSYCLAPESKIQLCTYFQWFHVDAQFATYDPVIEGLFSFA